MRCNRVLLPVATLMGVITSLLVVPLKLWALSPDTDLSLADASFWGEQERDFSGSSVSGEGDVNGDGYDDLLIGAHRNSEGGLVAGQTYLIFGKATGWAMDTDLSMADASFLGEENIDGAGWSISGVGDVNGDGYDDLLIGAYRNEEGGELAGQTYLIFGKPTGWAMDTDLSMADASFWGEEPVNNSGISVSGVGDANGDGYDDFLIGAYRNDEGGELAGQTYLILGKATGWAMDTNLSMADASFWGEEAGDTAGQSVSGVGDVNGDGYDDFLIGAHTNDDGGDFSGQAYLILGKPTGWAMDTDLSMVDASFLGERELDVAGWSVSGAGDVNGDGYDDFLIGAYGNEDGGAPYGGKAYLILGKATGWAMDTALFFADASFWGEEALDRAGWTVSGAGDTNGDGYDDFLIGAWGADDGENEAGQAYLILGKEAGWVRDTDLSLADASFWGEEASDYASRSISGVGDVNGDGYDDFLIGASGNDDGGIVAGQTYLLLGDPPATIFADGFESGDTTAWSSSVSLSRPTAKASFLGPRRPQVN